MGKSLAIALNATIKLQWCGREACSVYRHRWWHCVEALLDHIKMLCPAPTAALSESIRRQISESLHAFTLLHLCTISPGQRPVDSNPSLSLLRRCLSISHTILSAKKLQHVTCKPSEEDDLYACYQDVASVLECL